MPFLEKRYNDANGDYWREEIEKFMVAKPCPKCGGARLKPFPLAVKIKDKNIFDFTKMSIDDEFQFITDLYLDLTEYQLKIAKQILDEIRARLKFLIDVGLHYLDLARMAGTLSGGESQRVKLALELQKKPTGKTLYILDEPTTGLHSDDVARLLMVLQRIVDHGDTVLVIEHNLDVIKCADYIIDLGPDGGDKGGQIIATGTPEEVKENKSSYTGIYLKKMLS